jgi:hypothetical protein
LAFWEQNGRFFDVEDRLLVPGEKAPKPAAEHQPDELRRLDKSLPFAAVNPPWLGDKNEYPRPIFHEQLQDGRICFFDRNGDQVRPGKSAVKPAAPPPQELAPNGKPPAADWMAINSPAELFQRADELLDNQLRERARAIFGTLNKPCPPTRPDIMRALLVTLGYSAKYAENWQVIGHSFHCNQQPKLEGKHHDQN